MGSCRSKEIVSLDGNKSYGGKLSYDDIATFNNAKMRTVQIPLEVQIAHFTPATFPIVPMVSHHTFELCEKSWLSILEKTETEDGAEIQGVTMFYNEFYRRLETIDSNGRFEAILSRHTNGSAEEKIIAKGAILVRIMKFALGIAKNFHDCQLTLFMLGRSHAQKEVRPWQYAALIDILLQTLSAQLGSKATNDVMEAWVHLFAFILRSLLPPAIEGQVVETEIYINTSSEFSGGRVMDEVAQIEEDRIMKKKYGGSDRGSVRSESINGDSAVSVR